MNRLAAIIPLLLLSACATAGGAGRQPSIGLEELSPVFQMSIMDEEGPWAIHVVEVHPRACGIEFRTVKAGDRLAGRAPTSEMARQLTASTGRPAMAAINGDFFEGDGSPVNGQISDGRVIRSPGGRPGNAPGTWPVFGIDADGRPFIDVLGFTGRVSTTRGPNALATRVNVSPAGNALALYNRHAGEATPSDTGVVELRLRALGDPDRMSGRGIVVSAPDSMPAGLSLASDEVVLAGRGTAAAFLREKVALGDTLAWTLRTGPVAREVREMIGGSHRLVRDGVIAPEVDSAAASFGPVRHPRTAVGWRADGTILLVAIDGRQPEHSVGTTLRETAQVMLDLEAVQAINLDGGGSTTQVFSGRVVNRPSDAEGERAVGNALVVLGATGGCEG